MFIYGRQPVLEALRSQHEVKRVVLAGEASGKAIGIFERACQKRGISLQKMPKNQLQKFVGPVVHQGVIAEIDFNPFLNEQQFWQLIEEKAQPLLLILDHIQDTHNVGAILRTAEIVGVDCVVMPEKGSAPLNATVAKTSAGALFYTRFRQVESLEEILQKLNEKDIAGFAALPWAEQTIYEANFRRGMALVIGSEDKGVRKNLLKFCSQSVKIPQFGHVNSLNASVSTAIILYEVVRQRHFS